ncbi:MAG: hypothetical protein COV45_06185 [Deltaproteobacteria bacterium CG11_big_fil_rev_8_21_14_0_20_47_16]|nr:MAG: hypothetical protein COV45_06185 [Deltaproteobacteria bacterium CG11_big_fil_rev_8_21_14_0_20_47_16]
MNWKWPLVLIVLFISSAAFSADRIETLLQGRNAQLNECMAHLPARESIAWQDSRGRGTFPESCKREKLLRDDARDMQRYQKALYQLAKTAHLPSDQLTIAQEESQDIAIQMVEITRKLSDEFQMVHSSLINNMLVNFGVKKGGQCYQWVRGLLAGLPQKPYHVYERWWGGAHLHKILENNGLVWTVRGQPLKTGIVYDAWRGNGDPWWRLVTKDHYPWMVRFDEQEILSGSATVEGIAEIKAANRKQSQ